MFVEGEVPLGVYVPALFLGAPPAFTAARTLIVGVGAHQLARAATEHLLDLGHSTVRHLAGPRRWYATEDRIEGWQTAPAYRRAHEPPVLNGDWSAASGYAAGREPASGRSVTALFVAGAEMAVGLIHALRKAERRVPENVSVVGFDGQPGLRPCVSSSDHGSSALRGRFTGRDPASPSRHREAGFRTAARE